MLYHGNVDACAYVTRAAFAQVYPPERAEDESQALLNAIKEYEANKWKEIGKKIGKPAKACEQYAKENFRGKVPVLVDSDVVTYTSTRGQPTHALFPRHHLSLPGSIPSRIDESIAEPRRFHKVPQFDENRPASSQALPESWQSLKSQLPLQIAENPIGSSSSEAEQEKAGSPLGPVHDKSVSDKLERISALILSSDTESTHGAYPDDEHTLSGPDLFSQKPEAYFSSVKALQQQIFTFGQEIFGDDFLQIDGQRHTLLSPSSYLTTKGQSQSNVNSEQVMLMLVRNRDLAMAIKKGLDLADQANFLERVYNIIVVDARRPHVLRVIGISKLCVEIFLELLTEAIYCFKANTESTELEKTLDDICEATRLNLLQLGLEISTSDIYNNGSIESLLEKCIRMCDTVFPALAVMFLGLVSFVTSHMDVEKSTINWHKSPELHIQTINVNSSISMTRRPLLCLNKFLQKPVWSFSTSEGSASQTETQSERYYLSTSLEDFAALWGPVRVDHSMSLIMTRGGFIRRSTSLPALPSLRLHNSEHLYHWYNWTDRDEDQEVENKLPPASTGEHLLIGCDMDIEDIPGGHKIASMDCKCSQKRNYLDHFSAFELKTKIPSWKLEERTTQMTAGQYVSLTYGHTWKFSAGWTLKDVILEDWEDAISANVWHIPKPFYLDYLLILEISQCTGHSRRISVWMFLKTQALRSYLEGILERETFRDFSILVEYFAESATFADIWKSITPEAKGIFKVIVRSLFNILKSTGVGEDSLLQAWDITSKNRVDGRRVNPHWCLMVKDDLACATFAVITDLCMAGRPKETRKSSARRPSSSLSPSSAPSTILQTTLCIVKVKTLETTPRMAGTDAIGNFDEWKVPNVALSSPPGGVDSQLEKIRARHVDRSGFQSMMSSTEYQLGNREHSSPPLETQPRSKSSHTFYDNGTTQSKGKELALAPTLTNDFSYSSLDFKNGKGEIVGKLTRVLEKRTRASVYLDTLETCSLVLKWTQCKNGILSTIQKKEKAADEKIIGWVQKKPKSIFPWMINYIAPYEESAPYAIEYIRGGEADAGQQIVRVLVR